jgi:tetratricopeptide (TPR) repeat protein
MHNNTNIIQEAVQFLRAGDKERAYKLLQQAIRNNPEDERAWMYFSLATDDKKLQYSSLQRAIQINPKNDKTWVYLALASENTKQRLACLKRAVEINPTNTEAWNLISQVEAEANIAENKPSSGLVHTSLIVGFLSAVGWLLPIVGFPVSIVGVALGIAAWNSSKQNEAVAGVVLSIIGLIASVINAIIGASMFM